ncbi:hypothetical protein GOBAR_DD27691 [Gossypium barbadense]|nr:hypothetical protein GOBAR_DD27691 [Gossypium barbadense]
MGKNTLPPGFRFHPTDVELVMYYLKRKVLGQKLLLNVIAKVDVYKFAPWDLPDMSCMKTGDLKWYFYCPIEKKYARGDRVNRATIFGYWKATGKDRPVKYNGEVVGMIKTLVFHKGKAPRGDRTDWVMHEYRLEEKILADRGPVQDMYMLYVVFKKDGVGPRNGSQYGAPFKEEEWSDDEQADVPGAGSLCGLSTVAVGGDNSSCVPESVCVGPSVESSGWCTQPSMGHTNGDVNVTTAIDTNAYAAPTCADAPEVPNRMITCYLCWSASLKRVHLVHMKVRGGAMQLILPSRILLNHKVAGTNYNPLKKKYKSTYERKGISKE